MYGYVPTYIGPKLFHYVWEYEMRIIRKTTWRRADCVIFQFLCVRRRRTRTELCLQSKPRFSQFTPERLGTLPPPRHPCACRWLNIRMDGIQLTRFISWKACFPNWTHRYTCDVQINELKTPHIREMHYQIGDQLDWGIESLLPVTFITQPRKTRGANLKRVAFRGVFKGLLVNCKRWTTKANS